MYSFERSVTINRSQQEVFDYATNPANDALWQSGVESSEWTSDGPPGVGSINKVVRNFMGRKIASEVEMTAWDPPNQTGGKTIGGPVPMEVTTKYEANGGGTRLTLSGQAEFGGFFKLAEGLVGKQVEKQIEADLAALKKLLEEG